MSHPLLRENNLFIENLLTEEPLNRGNGCILYEPCLSFLFGGLMSLSTVFQSCGDGATTSCLPGLEVIKLFSSSAQLSMKFQLLINVEIVKNCGQFRFKTQKLVIYPAYKC